MHSHALPAIDWVTIHRSLLDGDYEETLKLLEQVQAQATVTDDWLLYASSAISTICQMCIQYQEAAEWHRRSRMEAEEREIQFRRQMAELLLTIGSLPTTVSPNFASQSTLPAPADPSSEPPYMTQGREQPQANGLSWWQRFKSRFRRKPKSTERLGADHPIDSRISPPVDERHPPSEPVYPPPHKLHRPLHSEPLTLHDVETLTVTELVDRFAARQGTVSQNPPGPANSWLEHSFSDGTTKPLHSELQRRDASQHGTGQSHRQGEMGRSGQYEQDDVPEANVNLPHSEPVGELPAVTTDDLKQLVPADTDIAIYAFGRFHVYLNGQLIDNWKGFKGLSVFKYLALNRSKQTSKEMLLELFWPNSDPESARRNLHQAIYAIRQCLRQYQPDVQHILFENDRYTLNPELKVWVDVEAFDKQVRAGNLLTSQLADLRLAAGENNGDGEHRMAAMRPLQLAEALYTDELLTKDLYEEWTIPIRSQLRDKYLNVSFSLAGYFASLADYGTAITQLTNILAYEPCDESAHRELMRCYVNQKQRHLAVRQYRSCVQILHEQMGVQPSPETNALYQEITAING